MIVRLAANYSASAEGYAESRSPVIRPPGRWLEALPGPRPAVSSTLEPGPERSPTTFWDSRRRRRRDRFVRNARPSGGQSDGSRGDGRDDPRVQNRTFEIAVLAFVLFRVPDPCAALTEVKRALRHRGTVEVTTWAVDPATPASQIWDKELRASGAWDPSPQPPDQDDLMNTPDKLERLLHGAGFAPERIWIEHLEYQWAFPRFTGLRTSFGASKRRLATLDPPTRAAFGDRNNERMSRLSSKELMCRGTAICATAVT